MRFYCGPNLVTADGEEESTMRTPKPRDRAEVLGVFQGVLGFSGGSSGLDAGMRRDTATVLHSLQVSLYRL